MMKSVVVFLFTLPTLLLAQTVTKLVPVTNLFVPNGFDDNDNTEVVVSGYLPDSCYKAPVATVKNVHDNFVITVSAIYKNDGSPCADVAVPFIETVRLGALKAKSYSVSIESATLRKSYSVTVKSATASSVDDFNYAYVTGVRHTPGNRKIMIDGYNVSDCFKLKEVKVESNGVDTYAILPIMEKINEFCPRKMTPISFEAVIPNTINKKEILLHVRSMQGNSVNSLYYTR